MSEARLWNKNYIQLLLLEICLQLGLYIIRPVVSSYAVVLGASLAAAGFASGLSSGASLAARPFCGRISDRLNKKSLLVASSFVFFGSAVGCAITSSLIIIDFLLVVQGIAFAFKSTLVISLTRMVVPQSKIGSAIGWLSIAFTIASALGPTLGSFLGERYGFNRSFLVAGAVFLAGLVLSASICIPNTCNQANKKAFKRETGKRSSFDFKESLSRNFYPPAIPCSLVDCMAATAQGTTVALIFLIALSEGIEGVWSYFIVYSAVTAVSRPLSGTLNDRYGATIVVPLFVIASCGMLVLFLSSTIVGVIVAAMFMALGQAPIHSVMQAESVRTASEGELARAANTSYLFPDIGMFLGPLFGGAVMGSFGGRAVLLVNFLYLLFGLTIALVWCCRKSKG